MRLDKDNKKSKERGNIRKMWRFSRNDFWKNIGCTSSAHTFDAGGGGILCGRMRSTKI